MNKLIYCGFENETVYGTCLQDKIETSYKSIVKTFGKQNQPSDGYKVDAEWLIITPKGVATIYNYKDGKNYCGNDGLAIRDITEWHIGGASQDVVPYIVNAITKTNQANQN